MNRKDFLKNSMVAGLGTIAGGSVLNSISGCVTPKGALVNDNFINNYVNLTQKPLGYSYDALEPYIDKVTMELHHDKHAAAYLKNAMDGMSAEGKDKTIGEVLGNITKYGARLRNHLGGHVNHELFWQWMSPNKTELKGSLKLAIEKRFTNYETFEKFFITSATSQFGSGWAWLTVGKFGALSVMNTPNQDNPLMNVVEKRTIPILGIDVWEHAYYLKYQNKRLDYVKAFLNVVNWDRVQEMYDKAITL
jgi:superoxide dismutase, Fe-Mn family